MNKETLDLVRGLADKLGTTAEHLWGVLVKQAPISSACDLGVLIMAIVSSIIIIFQVSKGQEYQEGKTKQKFFYEHDELAMGITVISGGVLIISIIILIVCFATIMSGFFNPEYWAFKQIVK